MTTIVKNEIISIEPRFLDGDFYNHVSNTIRRNQEKKECNKDIGYILNVSSVGEVINAEVSPASAEIVVTVPVEMVVFKPVVGEKHVGEICDVTSNGLFASIYERQKVLIQRSSMSEYEFDSVWSSYKCGDKIIKNGDKILLEIKGVKYTKQRFACFASLISDKEMLKA